MIRFATPLVLASLLALACNKTPSEAQEQPPPNAQPLAPANQQAQLSEKAGGAQPAQPAPVADKMPATPEALKAEIETLRDAKVAWRKIDWRTCLLDALKESGREKKPVFLWVLGGAPADGRC